MNKLYMEHVAPPLPNPKFNSNGMKPAYIDIPKELTKPDVANPTLSNIANVWDSQCSSCSGNQPTTCCDGDKKYANNCAHFLSNALVKSGFVELLSDSELYKCDKTDCVLSIDKRRPIRAREMWEWFKRKSTKNLENVEWSDVPKGSGWWAVFQLDEKVYWGGHVIVLDTDLWKYYGTCNYPEWRQYLYQW